jgi:hypothetical protein
VIPPWALGYSRRCIRRAALGLKPDLVPVVGAALRAAMLGVVTPLAASLEFLPPTS